METFLFLEYQFALMGLDSTTPLSVASFEKSQKEGNQLFKVIYF